MTTQEEQLRAQMHADWNAQLTGSLRQVGAMTNAELATEVARPRIHLWRANLLLSVISGVWLISQLAIVATLAWVMR